MNDSPSEVNKMKDLFEEFEVIDLTMNLVHNTPAFPLGLQEVRIERELSVEECGINADKISMSCHAGTHLDSPRHFCPQANAEYLNEIPLCEGRLVGRGVVVDISPMVEDYDIYIKREILNAGVEVRKGDILIIHTGYHRFQQDLSGESEARYFYRHPGPSREFAQWCIQTQLYWLGVDCGSQDHPMNTGLRGKRPEEDLAFCRRHRVNSVGEIFPQEHWQIMHRALFSHGIIHVENVGGDIHKVLNRRCAIGSFPLKIRTESSPCRLAVFIEKEH